MFWLKKLKINFSKNKIIYFLQWKFSMQKIIEKNVNVDVVLPNYNKEKYLKEAIESVIAQTYKNWHMYILDDSSSDNSWEIIKKFSNLG